MSEADIQELHRLRREKKKLKSNGKMLEFANICNRIGEILSHLGRHEEALEEHKTEKAICVQFGDSLGEAIANRKIGECQSELGNYESALEHQHKHLEIAERLKNVVEEQRAWATIGRTHLYRAETLSAKKEPAANSGAMKALNCAEEAFLKSLDRCSRLQSDVDAVELSQMQGRLFLNIGLVLDQRGDLDGCAHFIQKAIVINTDHGLGEDLQRCHHSLSLIHRRHGELRKALRHAQQATDALGTKTDPEELCELLTLQGHLLLLLSNFKESNHVLRKTRKMTVPDGPSKEEAFKYWKIASKLCTTEEQLLSLPTDDFVSRVKLYERMGDLCCRVQNYEKGLYYYHRSLEFAERLGRGNKDFALLYVSLAQTYSDLAQHDRAAHYYRLELGCYEGNLEESCKTVLNIADCEEFNGKEYTHLKCLYDEALGLAREAGSIRLQIRCLESLATVQETFGMVDERMQTMLLLKSLANDDDNDDDLSNSEVKDSVTDDSSIPSDESSTDDEVDESGCLFDKSQRKTKRFRMRKNEKGETPLHRACIGGDVKLVKQLLSQGHPVNIRDHSGWLPLHEASNHDYPEVVKLLLDSGAWVNDRGGDHCDGITPLHDAASNGNLAIMDMLLDRGASVFAKTTSGETVLSCLLKWRERARSDTDADILNASVAMEKKIRNMVENTGTFIADKNEVPSNEEVPCQALVEEDRLLCSRIDDWLINDMPDVPLGRKRRRLNRSPVVSRMTSATSQLSVWRQRTHSTARKRIRTADAENEQDWESGSSLGAIDMDFNERLSFEGDLIEPSIVPLPLPNTELATYMAGDHATASVMLRIKVSILEKLLLVPTPMGETVAWLAAEAAHRYYVLHGLRPVLTLSTKEGALLATVDVVNHVISPDEEVVGTVVSWDLQPLTERYMEACKSLGEPCYSNVMEVLRQTKQTVCLSNLRLTEKCVRPIFRSLQCQYSITELTLAGNRLGNEGLKLLGQSLGYLTGLQSLDLSCNDITDAGLSHLVSIFPTSNIALQRLEVLKLGFNPVLEGVCSNLPSLLGHLKALKELHLPSCCSKPRYDSSLWLKAISHASHIQLLNLCFCSLARENIANLGSTIANACFSLKRLELSGVSVTPIDARDLCKGLAQYLDGPTCQLKELVLSNCSLDDESLALLATSIVTRRISLLDISANTALSRDSIMKLMPLDGTSRHLSIIFPSQYLHDQLQIT